MATYMLACQCIALLVSSKEVNYMDQGIHFKCQSVLVLWSFEVDHHDLLQLLTTVFF